MTSGKCLLDITAFLSVSYWHTHLQLPAIFVKFSIVVFILICDFQTSTENHSFFTVAWKLNEGREPTDLSSFFTRYC
ncbi:hypothetical protein CW304_00620 [Bacillus sp. UFRGS-B20]|nr:hypothetical protein CW304_00620 [Bacillus sp. UFRGS-B20]